VARVETARVEAARVEAAGANEVVDLVQAEREILSYDAFGIAVRDLAQRIVDDGFEPDWILAIARGGLVIGGALAYALGHKNVATINVEFYTGVDARLDVPVELPPVLNLDDIANRRVLVADDVADTGETLKLVLDKCRPAVEEIRSVVLYEKPRSVVSADYAWRTTDRWIDFPWSCLPVIGRGTEAS
jgi:hypoxanthine phosphoribosyltransferase